MFLIVNTFHSGSWNDLGGVDLLLHMLTNIVDLPVTKNLVKDSGMGKAIGAIEKHSLCRGGANEKSIQERVANIKDAWQASVKARKAHDTKDSPVSPKRVVRDALSAQPSEDAPAAKKPKVEHGDDVKKSSFSTLLEKVSAANPNPSKTKAMSSSVPARNGLSRPEAGGT